jgi:hypothetical protein
MGWLRGRKQEDKKPAETAKVNKPTIYFATKSGITDNRTDGGLLAYGCNSTERHKALGDIGEAFRTQGFSYESSVGLIFQGENEEDAKNKLFSQRDNKITEDDLKKLEKKWTEIQKAKTSERGTEPKKQETGKKEEDLEKYNIIPEEMRKKLIGKIGIEAEYGINVDYEAAAKDLHIWKTFKS